MSLEWANLFGVLSRFAFHSLSVYCTASQHGTWHEPELKMLSLLHIFLSHFYNITAMADV